MTNYILYLFGALGLFIFDAALNLIIRILFFINKKYFYIGFSKLNAKKYFVENSIKANSLVFQISIFYIFPLLFYLFCNISFVIIYRKNFQDYLKHPDHKQEFVSQWQSDFNSISDDLREDEETKAELHQRITVSKLKKKQ